MNTKIDDFIKVRKELLKIINNFPLSRLKLKFYDDWTIKEVVGHISAWDKYFTIVLGDFKDGKIVKYWGNIDDFNHIEVNKRKNVEFLKLREELEKAGDEFIKAYKGLDKDLLEKKVWKDKKYTPTDILKIQVHHYEGQVKQVAKRKG